MSASRPAHASSWQVLTALMLPVGPAAVATLRYVIPYLTTDSSTEVAQKVSAHPSAQSAAVWLGFVASLVLVPSVLVIGACIRRDAPRLTAAAVGLLVPGYLVLAWLSASDAAVLFSVRHGYAMADAAAAYEELHAVVIVAGAIFVLGHVLGTVLLGCALWRVPLFPRWAAAIVAVSQPLHFVAAVIVGSHTLDLFAWGLNAVGFAVVGWVLVLGEPTAVTSPKEVALS
ncbi:MAG TPA: DUF4386 family protein [Nocardioidaceae bacterium]|nr:DUF4386 family protein [Nocardioidaceae bacterium]